MSVKLISVRVFDVLFSAGGQSVRTSGPRAPVLYVNDSGGDKPKEGIKASGGGLNAPVASYVNDNADAAPSLGDSAWFQEDSKPRPFM